MILCWSTKGGSGTSVMAAALALLCGRRRPSLLVDLAGDQEALLGLGGAGPGVGEWLAAGPDVPVDGLARIERPVTDQTGLVPRGSGRLDGPRLSALVAGLQAGVRPVVIDAGVAALDEVLTPLVSGCEHRLLVTRACYLGLRRVPSLPFGPTGVILVHEAGRALGRTDVEAVADAPVVARLPWDPAVARAVDAGRLASGLPRSLRRGLAPVCP